MKKIFFAIFAVAALASCMQDEIVSFDKGDAIAFNNAFVSNATKAAVDPSITSTSISEFVVYGTVSGAAGEAQDVNIFPGVCVQKEAITGGVGDTNTWYYAGNYVQYWIDGNKYKFAAVVNGDVTTNTTTGMPATIAYTANGTTDLLFAVAGAVGQASGNSAVEFTFAHLLSKVKFSVKNNIATNVPGREYTYRVTEVKITNAYESATYNVNTTYEFPTTGTGNATADQDTNSDWSNQDGTFIAEFGNINTEPKNATDVFVSGETFIKGTKTAESQYERLLIPGTKDDLRITCKIETVLNNNVIDTNTYDKTVDVTLDKGTAYNFLIELNLPGEAIKFTVNEVGDWAQGTGVNAPVYPEQN